MSGRAFSFQGVFIKRVAKMPFLCYTEFQKNVSERNAMNFKFNVHLTDADYLDYNVFGTIKSPYGRKQMRTFRILIAAGVLLFSLFILIWDRFTLAAFISASAQWVLLSVIELLMNPFFAWILKSHIKSLKKHGKMGYSPDSELEFFEDYFVETTPENKTEQKYSAVERISVIGNKFVYIHINNLMAYILPMASFASSEEYERFMGFMRTKCEKIDTY